MFKRRVLKTLIKDGDSAPPQATGQQAVGAPKVDTFARDTVPNVTYSTMVRR